MLLWCRFLCIACPKPGEYLKCVCVCLCTLLICSSIQENQNTYRRVFVSKRKRNLELYFVMQMVECGERERESAHTRFWYYQAEHSIQTNVCVYLLSYGCRLFLFSLKVQCLHSCFTFELFIFFLHRRRRCRK